MSKLRLITRDTDAPAKDDPTKKAYRYKYEVLAPAKLFGKRIRKYFRTQVALFRPKIGDTEHGE